MTAIGTAASVGTVAWPQVTGVVWWEMMVSHYQGVYRRAGPDESAGGYTRDFLQGPRPISDAFRAMFRNVDPPYQPLEYRWPGGSYTGGRIYKAADYAENRRVDVGQWTASGAPGPWRIGDPRTDPLITLEGSLELEIPHDATAQWETRLAPQRPYLVMVQLDRSQTELHLRAYLGAPPARLAEASLAQVPEALRHLMSKRGGAVLGRDLPDLWFDPEDLRDPWRLSPDSTVSSPRGAPAAAQPALGAPYHPAVEDVSSAQPEPFDVDPDERDRSTGLHAKTQNALSAAATARGCTPRRPMGEPAYDIAWEEPDGTTVVGEVKSVKPANCERQLRLGLGQVLRYRNLLEAQGRTVRAVLALSAAPLDDRWTSLCAEHGVGLIWMPDIADMLDAWLDGD